MKTPKKAAPKHDPEIAAAVALIDATLGKHYSRDNPHVLGEFIATLATRGVHLARRELAAAIEAKRR